MSFIEAPTNFYLGRQYDPVHQQLTEDVVYYDSRDLVTHAVVVGMTGSGKTGLCISMLEEAIIDNIPAIIIDPKGDITNLLLTFPDLQPQNFQPWINVDDARRAGLTIPEFSVDIARRWRQGLANWGIVPDRLRILQKIAKYSIYTPGSDAGLPISILASLKAPRDGWVGNEESLREKINGITTALLALVGKKAEPVKDKEHVLIANIFENAWRNGQDLSLEDIILQIQRPPFEKLGVFEVDDYMSEKTRYKLAMEMNNIIAAPSFESWMQGQSMDIPNLLYQPNGRPRVSIFYIAHLSEAERMFITTLILENVLGWMRTLSGTSSLRAILYIDEMYGYFPPYPKNPPTKEPLLRLLKQARAFGIGTILATQNPGDLDYKGLSNAGTWFIGRLQSDQDRNRVIAGLRSMASAQDSMDVDDIEDLIADIAPRVFLLRNVHEQQGPILLHTRWAMNYLRGPLTREQISKLMARQKQELIQQIQRSQPQRQQMPPAPPPMTSSSGGAFGAQSASMAPMPPNSLPNQMSQPAAPSQPPQQMAMGGAPSGFTDQHPPIPSSVEEFFLPARLSAQQSILNWANQTGSQPQQVTNLTMVYKPVLLAQTAVRYQDRKSQIFTMRHYAFHVDDVRRSGFVHWEDYRASTVDMREIADAPFTQGFFVEPPAGLTDESRMKALTKQLIDVIYNTARLSVPYNSQLNIYGDPDRDDSEFQQMVNQSAREQRDAEMDKTSEKYASQMEKLERQLQRKELELSAERKELEDRRREERYTKGEAFLSLWKGRTNYTLSRMSRSSRYRRQTQEDLTESHLVIDQLNRDMDELEAEFQDVLGGINDKWAQIAARNEDYLITPYKKDIQIELFGVGWIPHWYARVNGQMVLVSAFE